MPWYDGMKMPWETAIESVTGLISELTIDDDKQAEIRLELEKVKADVQKQLLSTVTTPRVDAFVKLLIAFKDIVIPLLRPLGAACMTGFGMYCHYNDIGLDGATQVVMDGAFPAWGASRHYGKKDELKASSKSKKIEKQEDQDMFGE